MRKIAILPVSAWIGAAVLLFTSASLCSAQEVGKALYAKGYQTTIWIDFWNIGVRDTGVFNPGVTWPNAPMFYNDLDRASADQRYGIGSSHRKGDLVQERRSMTILQAVVADPSVQAALGLPSGYQASKLDLHDVCMLKSGRNSSAWDTVVLPVYRQVLANRGNGVTLVTIPNGPGQERPSRYQVSGPPIPNLITDPTDPRVLSSDTGTSPEDRPPVNPTDLPPAGGGGSGGIVPGNIGPRGDRKLPPNGFVLPAIQPFDVNDPFKGIPGMEGIGKGNNLAPATTTARPGPLGAQVAPAPTVKKQTAPRPAPTTWKGANSDPFEIEPSVAPGPRPRITDRQPPEGGTVKPKKYLDENLDLPPNPGPTEDEETDPVNGGGGGRDERDVQSD